MLADFPHIKIPDFSGGIKSGVEALLTLNGKQKTFAHVKAVAEMNVRIAAQYGLDKDVCELCGYLHDVGAVFTADEMSAYAADHFQFIDEAETKYPFLLHQRISKVIAARDFGVTDGRALSAIECHSTLKANPSAYDMALFVADKLAWDQDGEAPFHAAVSGALTQSLEAASLAYMDYIVANKMILHPHEWFLAGAAYLRGVLG